MKLRSIPVIAIVAVFPAVLVFALIDAIVVLAVIVVIGVLAAISILHAPARACRNLCSTGNRWNTWRLGIAGILGNAGSRDFRMATRARRHVLRDHQPTRVCKNSDNRGNADSRSIACNACSTGTPVSRPRVARAFQRVFTPTFERVPGNPARRSPINRLSFPEPIGFGQDAEEPERRYLVRWRVGLEVDVA